MFKLNKWLYDYSLPSFILLHNLISVLKQQEELRKTERKNRDEFRKLMDEHIASGILTAKTHWRDYHSQVNCLLLWQFIFLFMLSVFSVKVQSLVF